MALQVLPGRLDFESYAGDDFSVLIEFADSDGVAYPVTASAFTAVIKRAAGDVVITVAQVEAAALRLSVTDTLLGTALAQDRWELRETATDRTWLAGDFVVSLSKASGPARPANPTITVGTSTVSTTVSIAGGSETWQALDADLTSIAGLTPSNDDLVQRKAGAWTNRTPAQVKTDLALVKGDVGLSNVDNTADTAKPVSTAQQTALDAKAPLASPTFTGTVSGVTKSMVGLGNVDNTTDTAKPVSTAQQTALDAKAPLASPALTGTPTVPTAAAGTNTTQIASTAFVAAAVSVLPAVEEATVARTLQLTDAGKVIESTNASATTITVPPNASVAFPLGSVVTVYSSGVGGVTIAAGAGVTIRNLAALSQYSERSLRKRATDEWVQS